MNEWMNEWMEDGEVESLFPGCGVDKCKFLCSRPYGGVLIEKRMKWGLERDGMLRFPLKNLLLSFEIFFPLEDPVDLIF